MEFAQLIEYNRAENLLFFLKKVLYEVKASVLELSLNIFRCP